MDAFFLSEILLVFGLAILVLVVFHGFHLPSLPGFLIVGMIVGPHGFQIIRDTHDVEFIAEFGVILLLFTIGLEFSVERFSRIQRLIWVAGPIQVASAITGVMLAGWAFGFHWKTALFWGFLISLSSTAVVLKLLSDKAILSSPQGKITLGILIFQDLCIIPMIFLTPFLAFNGSSEHSIFALAISLLKSAAVIAGIIIGVRLLVPRLLEIVVQQRSRELFLLTVLTICLGTAWLTFSTGLSLAIGAFLAGLIISESKYSQQILSDILPFRDSFGSLFFISIGMLFDVRLFITDSALVGWLIVGILLIKFLTTMLATVSVGYHLKVALLAGIFLAQVGEFSFVLAGVGLSAEVFSVRDYQLFLASSVVTLLLTPFMVEWAPRIVDRLSGYIPSTLPERKSSVSNHVIIIGFGVNGQNVARVLKQAEIPYQIIEMNPQTVWECEKKGEPIFFGDATRREVLLHANVDRARAMVIAISDPPSTRRVTALARQLNGTLHIIVRTRYIHEMEALYRDGASEVIPEEYETSVEIFARLLREYLIPSETIDRFVNEIRAHGYAMFRRLHNTHHPPSWLETELPGVQVESFQVSAGSRFHGKRLEELHLRGETGVTIVAVRRGGRMIANPDGKFTVEIGDLLIGLGDQESLKKLIRLIA